MKYKRAQLVTQFILLACCFLTRISLAQEASESCDKEYKKIAELFEKARRCEDIAQTSDCSVYQDEDVMLGCYRIVNSKYDLTLVKDAVRKYRQHCVPHEAECSAKPKKLMCADFECTDFIITSLNRSSVIEIAELTAKAQNRNLGTYNTPNVMYFKNSHNWSVFYTLKPPAPVGGHFTVQVDDKTGKAELWPGA